MKISINVFETSMSEDGVGPTQCRIEVVVKKNYKSTKECGKGFSVDITAEEVIRDHSEGLIEFVKKVVAEAEKEN